MDVGIMQISMNNYHTHNQIKIGTNLKARFSGIFWQCVMNT